MERDDVKRSGEDEDPVLSLLDAAGSAYRAHDAALKGELAKTRRAFERQRDRAESLRRALVEVHRALFGGNVYEMILRASVQITGATRGAYVAPRPGGGLRVRASVGVDGYPGTGPSGFLEQVYRRVLERGEPVVCNQGSSVGLEGIAPAEREEERFANFAATPVMLMRDLAGVVLVGDKLAGGFDVDDVETLISVGHHAGVAVENRRLEEALQRAYKEAYTEAHAREEVRRCSGTQFDPEVVGAFLSVLETPLAEDPDDDSWAECLVLPGLGDRHLLKRAS
jgi:GAF domain-containing protein